MGMTSFASVFKFQFHKGTIRTAKAGGYTGTRDEWVAQIQRVSMVDIGFDEEKGAIVIRS